MKTEIADLFGIYTIEGEMEVREENDFVPDKDKSYVFSEKSLRALMIWDEGKISRNIFVQGPTGSGKSSLVEQFCARVNRPVFRYGCHGKTEYSEFLGAQSLSTNGKSTITSFDDGPLTLAAKSGGVLLLDEANFLPAKVFGGLNGVLDGTPFFVPGSQELITPHPDFRIALTGNAVNGDDKHLYGGVNTLNIAARDRFLALTVNYMSRMDELQVLINIAQEKVPVTLLQMLVDFGQRVRQSRESEGLSFTASTRFLIKVVRLLMAGGSFEKDDLIWAANLAAFDLLPPQEAATLRQYLDIA